MLFYLALHYVDAFLAGKQLHPLNRDRRDEEIAKNGTIAPIFKDYRRLEDLSRSARYDIASYTIETLRSAAYRLSQIKTHVYARM